ncbi:hypothetical protein CEXT_127661 [Caerostris extrusa]|uniref:Uncharacterized protein n=1 Tax=Caerostris extrusa TaxID=172846 RepID=A0AAV4V220_CAEEX|nr:hypothetical protein CEXT_127661 [Caerostris extrusa]
MNGPIRPRLSSKEIRIQLLNWSSGWGSENSRVTIPGMPFQSDLFNTNQELETHQLIKDCPPLDPLAHSNIQKRGG